jgi:hypothetical protein
MSHWRAEKIESRSWIRNPYEWSLGMASRNCCRVHAAVGWDVTLKCRMRRVPISITMKTYTSRNLAVTVTRKSQATTGLRVIANESLPMLGGASSWTWAFQLRRPIGPHCAWRHLDAKLQREFIRHSCLPPGFLYHPHNKLANVPRQTRPPRSGLPAPEQLESLAMPADQRVGLDDHQRIFPVT